MATYERLLGGFLCVLHVSLVDVLDAFDFIDSDKN